MKPLAPALLAALLVACGAAPPPPPPPPPASPSTAEAATALFGCEYAVGDVPERVARFSHAHTPCWTNKYVDRIDESVRSFDLAALMAGYGLSRLQAVELQNHYRDRMRAAPDGDKDAAFGDALEKVKRGELESGVDPARMREARFIVVFDLDETLYDQRSGSAECSDVSFEYQSRGETKTKYIKMAPGWQGVIARIAQLGGAVVLFSANLDDSTLLNLSKITLDGTPLTESPLIAGIMTNSHLTRQSKLEPPGTAEAPWKGQPVFEPSKDLRHFDESLRKVVLVDDNPLRFFQFRNTRTFQKFKAHVMCGTDDPELKAAYAQALPQVLAELEESTVWLGANPGHDFATAYLPYSDLGQVTMRFLTGTRGWTVEQARAYVRAHPDVVSPRF